MLTVLRGLLRRSVMKKGLQGGSTFWLIVGALGLLRRGYDRLAPKSETIAFGERIRPGDELVLRYPGKPSRQTRKELKFIARRDAAVAAELAHTKGRLSRKIAKGGFGASRASKALRELTDLSTR